MEQANKDKVLRLTSPIPVSVNHYLKPRGFVKWINGRPTAMVTMYETADAKKYKKEFKKYVMEEVKKQGWEFNPDKTQNYYYDCVFYFDRIDKDPNNYFKIMLDAVTESETIWVDDNVVCERVNRIFYDSKNPRIEITVREVDYIGIFDSCETLDIFESKCQTCKRYKRNCKILRQAKEGRVQEEINMENGALDCLKFNAIK